MNVFSFCLYNPYNPYYYVGLLENIDLIHQFFPDWGIYVYIGNDVSSEFQEKLVQLGCTVRMTGAVGVVNMVHRFFAIDEPDVNVMFVRDADSRVHWKDRWAIQTFLASSARLHIIRDNKVHTTPILGGLWGIRKPFQSIRDLYIANPMGVQIHLGHDQNFLANQIYPRVPKSEILIHSSISWKFVPDEVLTPFPFAWNAVVWCGRGEQIGPPGVKISVLSLLNKA
jgi:hypothetical protein